MIKRIISIEAGVWWTKVAVADYRKKKDTHVYQAFMFKTPEHAVEDGYIRDKEELGRALRDELAKRSIEEKDVIFTLSSSKVVTREVTIPFVKDDKIEGIIEAQVRDYFPMDVSNYTISHSKLDVFEEDGKKQIKLLLIAIPDNLLANYCQFAEGLGLKVDTFDYIGNGTVQYMRGMLDDNSVVVQLEEQTTVISIIKDKKLAFQRVTPYGYSSALSAVIDNPVLGITNEYDAFDFLINNDVIFSRPYAHDAGDSEDVASRQQLLDKAYDELKESMNYHLRVVNTALEYYQNQIKDDFRGSLFIVGDGSRFAGLAKLFESELPLYLRDVNFGALVDIKVEKGAYVEPDRDPTMMAGLLTVIGAASNPIQVKAPEIARSASKQNAMKTAYTVLVGAIVISLLLVAIACFRQISAASEQSKLEEQIAELSYVEQIYDDNTLATNNLAIVKNIDDATYSNNEQLLSLIEDLEKQLPSDISVESLQATDTTVTMNMRASERISIGQMLLNLQKIPELTDATIPSVAESTDELGDTIWTYTVTATYADYPQEEETEEAAVSDESEEVEADE